MADPMGGVDAAPRCLRCADARLKVLPGDPSGMAFCACPTCGWQYARGAGQSLHDRWGSPLSLALYPVIFDGRPQVRAAEVAQGLHGQRVFRDRAEAALQDIERELNAPTQKVREILDLAAGEEDLREYLRLFCAEFRRLPAPPPEPEPRPGSLREETLKILDFCLKDLDRGFMGDAKDDLAQMLSILAFERKTPRALMYAACAEDIPPDDRREILETASGVLDWLKGRHEQRDAFEAYDRLMPVRDKLMGLS